MAEHKAGATEANGTTTRVALVTGASRGIGAAIAEALAAAGRAVILAARNEQRLAEVRDRIVAAGGEASVVTCDVSDAASLASTVEAAAKQAGRLDILVNNAGITRDALVLRMDAASFQEVLSTNLTSAFVASKAAARPMMRNQFGRIINIGSVSGLTGNAGQANYAAAKAGLIGLTKSLARELAGKSITANVVAPGFTDTEMTASLPDAVKDHVLGQTPLGRFASPAEIAAAVRFLASDEAGFITGQVLAVDGGLAM